MSIISPEKVPLQIGPALLEQGDARRVWVGPSPLTADEFLEHFENIDAELVNGVAIERMAAHLTHEKLFAWLLVVFSLHAEDNDLGIVLGSRTAVVINTFGARLPDIVFVQKSRQPIIEEKGITGGAPDLVVEIVSPGDRRADLSEREADYRSLGVSEIVFLDPKRKTVRTLLRQDDGTYTEQTQGAGETLTLSTFPALVALQTDWLFSEPRPTTRAALGQG